MTRVPGHPKLQKVRQSAVCEGSADPFYRRDMLLSDCVLKLEHETNPCAERRRCVSIAAFTRAL